MEKKTVYTLNIGNYEPNITRVTYPLMESYAKKIGAEFVILTEEKFPGWPMTYQKLQVHDLSKERGDQWSIFFDSDCMVHPDLFDVTAVCPRDHFMQNAFDYSPHRSVPDGYHMRDGRWISTCNWFTLFSDWTRDLYRPVDDLTLEEILARIHPLESERRMGLKKEHFVDDFVLSRNVARFGLKAMSMREYLAGRGRDHSMDEYFFHHYGLSSEEKFQKIMETRKRWLL